MVPRPLHLLTIGVLVVAGTLAFPARTSAGGAPWPPTLNTPQIWQNRETGYCMGVAGGRVVNGTPIIVWPCNGNDDQKWITVPNPDPSYRSWMRMQNVADPTKCLSVANASWRDGARMIIWDCSPTWNNHQNNGQEFQFLPGELPGYGFYSFGAWTDMRVGVAGASSAIGASVVQWHRLAGHGDQEWYPSIAG